jgi:hypothetical protein
MNTRNTLQQMMAVMLIWIFSSFVLAMAGDHIVIPLSSPVKPVTVNVTLYSGPVSVTGYAGKEVTLDVQSGKELDRGYNKTAPPAGSTNLRRISSPETGLVIHEENNVVSIGTGMEHRLMEVSLQVPFKTNLVLNTGGSGNIIVNKIEGDIKINNSSVRRTLQRQVGVKYTLSGNDIEVHQVNGEIEINNGRGSVLLDRISGSAIAYTYNGDLRASFMSVKTGKPMSFSSMNGTIDVWLPPGIKADVIAQSAGGVINSDYDIKINTSAVGPKAGGKQKQYLGTGYSNHLDRTIIGKINGGGPEIRFKTYKGNIYFRKFSEASAGTQTKK